MKIIRRVLVVPVTGILAVILACGAMIGSILFRLLSLLVSLAGICTIWAWLIGDHMAPLFAGVFVGCMALLLIGVFLQHQGERFIENQKNK